MAILNWVQHSWQTLFQRSCLQAVVNKNRYPKRFSPSFPHLVPLSLQGHDVLHEELPLKAPEWGLASARFPWPWGRMDFRAMSEQRIRPWHNSWLWLSLLLSFLNNLAPLELLQIFCLIKQYVKTVKKKKNSAVVFFSFLMGSIYIYLSCEEEILLEEREYVF